MSFLHPHTCECVKSELDVFSVPPTQTSIENGQWIPYKPISALTDSSPIQFSVPAQGSEYIDLSHTKLYLKASVTKEDGKPLTETDHAGPVNNFLHSLFSQVDVYLGQKLISPANNTYPYRSYIESVLMYGPAAKTSHLTMSLWYDDLPGKMDDTTGTENTGLKKRKQFTDLSKEVELLGHLHADIFNQEKFLINGVELGVKLVRSQDKFSLMSESLSVKVNIIEATLLIRRVKINPSVLIAHNKALEHGNAKYPITRTDVKLFTIPSQVQGKTLDNVYLGQLPKRCIIGFVSNKACNGDYKKNPYNFHHYNINYISLYVDGQQIPSKPLQPDFTSASSFVMAYDSMFSGTGIHFMNEGNGIDRESYANGNCLMAFDLSHDLSANSNSHWNLTRRGSLRIEVQFSTALTETINCVVYGEFDNILEIDKNRNVIIDYTS